jgi:hypothetical protein
MFTTRQSYLNDLFKVLLLNLLLVSHRPLHLCTQIRHLSLQLGRVHALGATCRSRQQQRRQRRQQTSASLLSPRLLGVTAM